MARERETSEMVAFARRAVRAVGRRVSAGDLEHLADLALLGEYVQEQLGETVAALRAEPNLCSWQDIADQLGVSRQAAFKRFAPLMAQLAVEGRRPGGQPTEAR